MGTELPGTAAQAGFPADKGERSEAAIAANVLNRRLEARAPNQKWTAGFTHIWTAEGRL